MRNPPQAAPSAVDTAVCTSRATVGFPRRTALKFVTLGGLWASTWMAGTVALPTQVQAQAVRPLAPLNEVTTALSDAQALASAPVRFFGLLIYDLTLWAGKGFDLLRYDQQAFALTLTYARALGGKDIAERSLTEMRRVGRFDKNQETQWLNLMRTAFPDVVEKDRITGSHDGKGGVQFWHNGRATAKTNDPMFARLFFGIWLAPQTSVPTLRDTLIAATAKNKND